MSKFVDKTSVVEAATAYEGGDLIGRDYKVTLPDVVPATVDVPGMMGTVNFPLLTSIESLETIISKTGVDERAARLCSPGRKDLLFKWVQDKVDSVGNVTQVGCKAEITGIPKSYMPAADIEVGSASEFDCTYETLVYKLYIDGALVFHINRMAGTLEAWDGTKLVDYSSSFDALL